MTINPKIIGIIVTLVALLQFIKKFYEEILKKFFGVEEIPKWLNFLIVNVLQILILLAGYIQDGQFTWQEIIEFITTILGTNGLFLIYKGLKPESK